ncbi:type II toxin-antitoxin system RelE/ParE family toxin [Pseudomonas sp. NPDC007930]|uniref:type II toxin-antitoxin system RelE/ParE family toxin n=1 Tax=Pseudomonas sp. NPDC007930 TaxID=3364417 RepID=UPI0036EA3265
MKQYSLRYTEVAQSSIEDQVEHLAIYHGYQTALNKGETLIDAIEASLATLPDKFPVSPQLSELGVLQYRELNLNGYRVFYRVIEPASVVSVELLLRGKRDVQQALIRYCLLQPL